MNENQDNRLEVVMASNFQEVLSSIKAVNKSLESMKTVLNSVTKTLGSFHSTNSIKNVKKDLDDTDASTRKLYDGITKVKNALSIGFNLGKLYLLWNVTKRIRNVVSGWIQSSVDFIETTNKFEVAMGNMTDKAYVFQNKLANAFGTVTKEMMNYQATFKNIMSSLPGLTNNAAEQVSETLVKLGLDYSSLYNVDQSTAMSRIQAALVGSVKPIRSDAGYDITEATIGMKAQELGIETSVRNLNQMEKRLLRIIVLMDQMRNTGAMQDLARTIEQPANQIKILKNQVQELGVWLGNVFIGTIGRILPYINGFVMALVAIVKTLAIFVGYTNTGKGLAEGLQVAETAAGGISSGIGSAAKSAKELRKTLMGFDVLNVIQKPTESSGGGGGGGGVGGADAINPALLAALKDYDNLMGNVQMKATEIRDKIMEWLGFTKIVNEETGEVTWKLNEGYTRLEFILDLLKLIGLTMLNWKISSTVLKFFENLGLISGAKALKLTIGLTLAITGIEIVFNGVKKMLKGDLSPSNLIKSLGGSALASTGIGLLTSNPIGWTVMLALTLLVVTTYAFKSRSKWLHQLAELEGLDYDGMTLKEKANYEIDLSLQILGLKEGKNPLIKAMKQMWDETKENVKKKLAEIGESIKKWFDELPNKVMTWAGEFVGKVVRYLVSEVPKKLEEFRTWLFVTVPEKLHIFFTVTLPQKWNEFINWLKTVDLKMIAKDIVIGFINGWKEKWDDMVKKVNEWINSFIKGFKKGFGVHSPSTIFSDIGKNIIQGLWNGLKDTWNNLIRNVDAWVQELKNKFNIGNIHIKTPHISWSNDGASASGTIRKILELLNLPTRLPRLNVSWYAAGGLPDMGELFVAREAGPELVGSIGNKNAVVNNQQIVEAVSTGVANAVSQVLGNGGSSYQLYIDGEQITDVVQRRMTRRANITGMAMGV